MFAFRLPRYPRRCGFLPALVLALITAVGARAGDVLHYLPENALGFVVIRNVEGANTKIERFMRMFEIALPAPLAFVKYATGLDEGIDQQGDVLVALLPGTQLSLAVQPMVMLPVSDYAQFAASIHGDASGEICRVTIAGEDVLIARKDTYALLMNLEHRETLERLVGLEPKALSIIKPLQPWLASTDIAITLMPAGADKLFNLGRQEVAQQQEDLAEEFGDPEFAEMLEEMRKSWAVYRWVLELLDTEIEVFALGISIDEQTNIRIGKRVLLNKKGELSHVGVAKADDSLLRGYSAGPFVATGGGPIASGWARWFAKMNRRIAEQFPETEGYTEFEEEDWEKVEQSYRTLYDDLRSFSFLIRPASAEEPLISNIFTLSTVEDSASYLESFKKSFELDNDLLRRSTLDVDFQYEIAPVTIAEGKGYEIVADLLTAIGGDNNVLFFDTVIKKVLGEDGKLHIYVIAADETHVVTGIQSREQLAALIEDVRSNENGLKQQEELQVTERLVDSRAPWRIFLSPQGCIQLASRFLNEVLTQFAPGVPQLPEYPATPPIGFSMNIADSVLEGDLVLPFETLEGLAKFIKACKEEFDD